MFALVGMLLSSSLTIPFDPSITAASSATVATLGVGRYGYLKFKKYVNAPEAFGGSPKLRKQFVAQQYPWFSKAEK